MNNPQPLEGPRLKVERAKEHIRQLKEEIRAFNERQPYRILRERNQERGGEIYRIQILEYPPKRWSTIIGDVVHNLRSALDHLANDLILANGNVPNESTEFPILRSINSLETSVNGKVKGASPAAIRLIKRLKPYKGGNKALWWIRCLDIVDKHRIILSVHAAHTDVAMQVIWWDSLTSPAIHFRKHHYPLKDDDEIFRIGSSTSTHPETHHELKFTFNIAFGDGEVVEGELVISTLQQLIDFTERIIDIFDRHIFIPLLQ